jgi:hypothetical protein
MYAMCGISPVMMDKKVKARETANAETKADSSVPFAAILKPAIEIIMVNIHVIIFLY